ncbi:hypothetical protein HZA40_03105 [Candidatus Peregrinibacteria bacterium]|nr:hypothetical protein [Candidatus Peregrinibacteria bacterium]
MPTENFEKYRDLYNLVNDKENYQAKIKLFGNAGLFGSLEGDHRILQLFAEFIHELKMGTIDGSKHELNKDTVNSTTFIEFLTMKGGKDPYIKQKIEEIKLMRGGAIKDVPPEQNTLLRFAKVLDHLDIIKEPQQFIGFYKAALRNVLRMSPLAGKQGSAGLAAKAATPANVPTATAGAVAKATPTGPQANTTSGQTMTPISKPTNIPTGFSFDIDTGTTTLPIPTEKPAESAPQPLAQKPAEPAVPKPVGAMPQKPAEPAPEPLAQTPIQPAQIPAPSSVKAAKISKEEIPEQDIQVPKENLQIPNEEQVVAPQSQYPQRRVRRLKGPGKKGLRMAKIHDLKESAQNRGPEQTAQQNQNNQPDNNQPNRSAQQEDQEQSTEDQPATGSFGKRLAKLAGAGVGGGTALALFSGSSDATANAATFAASHGIHILKPIIAIIHLFL